MTIYYVATLARYVLVEAENEAQARERGYAALQQQQDHVKIRTIRHATSDEIVARRKIAQWNLCNSFSEGHFRDLGHPDRRTNPCVRMVGVGNLAGKPTKYLLMPYGGGGGTAAYRRDDRRDVFGIAAVKCLYGTRVYVATAANRRDVPETIAREIKKSQKIKSEPGTMHREKLSVKNA